ncbi:alpha/beta fold hydrolase [Acinetobacter sp. TGL-Y2]|uniref:alpha/beta fold hydrolase n=1 Tax=Acinetobacter sp. TGL-Y2 TaxID=1407071 RepID=UPI000B0516D2|nr:alpha/beta hydrolase [Acinetobacter sp. TGL-Y2]
MENLIFLPGASGNIEFWQPVLSLLSPNYTKQIMTYPEFGGMPAKVGVRSFDDLQLDVISSIKSLSQEQPSVVIAQSMGGIFAVQAALHLNLCDQKCIKALVLVTTSGGIDLSRFAVADWREDYSLNFSVPDWFVQCREALDNQLDQIKCPVLLIWGDDDPISPLSVGRYSEKQFKQARLEIIEGGQHDLAFKYAERVADLIEGLIHSIE